MAQMVDYNGKLAIDFGTFTDHDRPVNVRGLAVSNIDAKDWQHITGYRVEFVGNMGTIDMPGRYPTYVDATDWKHTTDETPIKKPRDGRDYTWRWLNGRWIKEWV